MCGAGLDAAASGKAEDSSENRRSGRVRQRTMSHSQEELNSAVSKIREEMVPTQLAAQNSSEDEKGRATVEIYPEANEAQSRANQAANETGEGDDPLSAYIEEVSDQQGEENQAASQGKLAARGAESEKRVDTDPKKGFRFNYSIAASQSNDALPQKKSAATPPAPETTKKPQASEWLGETREVSQAVSSSAGNNRAVDTTQKGYDVPRRTIPTGNRLAGWLVSFEQDPSGKAVEVREGKFFVTRVRMRETDLVIDNKTVSSPHALCAIGDDCRMRVQDLMSEEGVSVKRGNEDDFVRINETVELEHGDSVRFGGVEFLVCLVAHVGVK
jgi:hypothetical protein